MHLDNLKVFTDLVESESFSQAARLNDITQSAVSQQLRMLEKQLGVFLIDRSHKQFRLTQEGICLQAFAKDALQRYQRFKNDLQSLQQVLSGAITVSTVYSIGLHQLPFYLKRFMQAHPSVNVQVQYRRSSQVYEDVIRQEQDLGIVAFPEPHSALTIIPFKNDPMVLIAAPNHPLAEKHGLSLQDLNYQPFVGFVEGVPTRTATDGLLNEAGITINRVMSFDNIETIKSAVEIGAGLAFVPASTVIRELEQRTLCQLSLVDPTFSRPLAIIHRKDRVLSPAAEQFVSLMQS